MLDVRVLAGGVGVGDGLRKMDSSSPQSLEVGKRLRMWQ